MAREAAARLLGDGDGGGARQAGDRGVMGSQGRDGIGGEEISRQWCRDGDRELQRVARTVGGGGDCGVLATCARTGGG